MFAPRIAVKEFACSRSSWSPTGRSPETVGGTVNRSTCRVETRTAAFGDFCGVKTAGSGGQSLTFFGLVSTFYFELFNTFLLPLGDQHPWFHFFRFDFPPRFTLMPTSVLHLICRSQPQATLRLASRPPPSRVLRMPEPTQRG